MRFNQLARRFRKTNVELSVLLAQGKIPQAAVSIRPLRDLRVRGSEIIFADPLIINTRNIDGLAFSVNGRVLCESAQNPYGERTVWSRFNASDLLESEAGR